ncbi:hypothetical protein AB0A98_06125 [Streptomyces chrestomyceticus]|uniref:hypothetical protein n=1 Tax=Streptomyces chrestomyceticus TaxID=68185 RepID=UPI0033FE5A83
MDWSEEQIEQEAAVLGPNSWGSTFDAESADEAFQMAGRATCDETQLDAATKLFDVRSGRQLMYEGARSRGSRARHGAGGDGSSAG